jgi:Domain of unknown function (DUF4365)
MNDATLPDNNRKAALSFAYLAAISAHSGYNCEKASNDDFDSIDASVKAGGSMRPQIDVQLKATASADWQKDGLHFQLKKKNFNDLCATRVVPIILVVFELPKDEAEWCKCSEERLILQRAAWWLSLSGLSEIEADSKVVVLPLSQRLDSDCLKNLMGLAREFKL